MTNMNSYSTYNLLEVEATDFFFDQNGEDTFNLKFCKKHARLKHTEAFKFILYITPDNIYEDTLKEMIEFGCNTDFIFSYKEAKEIGADMILYYT